MIGKIIILSSVALLSGCVSTGNDSQMLVQSNGGYEYIGGTKITTSEAQKIIKDAIDAGTLNPDILN